VPEKIKNEKVNSQTEQNMEGMILLKLILD